MCVCVLNFMPFYRRIIETRCFARKMFSTDISKNNESP